MGLPIMAQNKMTRSGRRSRKSKTRPRDVATFVARKTPKITPQEKPMTRGRRSGKPKETPRYVKKFAALKAKKAPEIVPPKPPLPLYLVNGCSKVRREVCEEGRVIIHSDARTEYRVVDGETYHYASLGHIARDMTEGFIYWWATGLVELSSSDDMNLAELEGLRFAINMAMNLNVKKVVLVTDNLPALQQLVQVPSKVKNLEMRSICEELDLAKKKVSFKVFHTSVGLESGLTEKQLEDEINSADALSQMELDKRKLWYVKLDEFNIHVLSEKKIYFPHRFSEA